VQVTDSKILIVDDNEDNRYTLARRLRRLGYSAIDEADDGLSGLKAISQAEYDLVLLDIMMPGMDGFGVLEELRKEGLIPGLPVVVISAIEELESAVRSIEMGAEDYLPKPFNPVLLGARVHACLEKNALRKIEKAYRNRLEERVAERTKELERSRRNVIRSLGIAGEYRDYETGTHVLRMSKYCRVLARKVGLPDQFVEDVYLASSLHDLGKIGIPDRILLKPGKLDPDEWEVMKTHASIGAEILKAHQAPVLIMAGRIALSHHEMWDGNGYPNGKKGEDIPIEGRITAICDVFDALSSKRPYKEPWPFDKIKEFIIEKSGSHFDPNLADHFLEIYDEMVNIRESLPDDPNELAALEAEMFAT